MRNRRKRRQRITNSSYGLRVAAIGGIVLLVAGVAIFLLNQAGDSGPRAIAKMRTRDFHALLFSGADQNTAFFGHHEGLMISTDQGVTWRPTSLLNADAMGLASPAANPSRIYAAGHGVFFRSDDAGKTWNTIAGQLMDADIHAFASSPVDANRVYALVAGQGLVTSADGGANWQPIASPPGTVTALAASGTQTVIAGTTQNGAFKSDDGGQSWQLIGNELKGVQVISLASSPDGAIFATTERGLYRRSAASVWQALPLSKTLLAVTVSPRNSQFLLVLSDQGEIFRSRDGGQTWDGR